MEYVVVSIDSRAVFKLTISTFDFLKKATTMGPEMVYVPLPAISKKDSRY